jgi:NAD(P)H-dependent FMN reductase
VTRIIGLSGSLRKGSFNSALLRAAAASTSDGTEIEIASIRGIPLYDGDVEASEGIPASVSALKEAIVAADGLLLVTPEYNNSIPGVFKNAIDWLSRPASDIKRVFGGRPVALLGASPGGFGTILSQNAWLPVLRTLGMELWSEGRLLVSRASSAFAADGTLADAKMQEQLRAFMEGFAAFAARHQRHTRSGHPRARLIAEVIVPRCATRPGSRRSSRGRAWSPAPDSGRS